MLYNARNAVCHNAQQIIEDEAYKSLHWRVRHYVEDVLNYSETHIMRDFVWGAVKYYFKQNE